MVCDIIEELEVKIYYLGVVIEYFELFVVLGYGVLLGLLFCLFDKINIIDY